jgi:glycerate kinase
LLEGCPIVISRTVLIAAGTFEGFSARRVGSAIARGLAERQWQADVCPIVAANGPSGNARELVDALDLDARMRQARAVVIAAWRLRESALAGTPAFEIATRARQGGVPAYAVTGENALNAFDARMLDLQVILEARAAHGLTAAGRRLGQLV